MQLSPLQSRLAASVAASCLLILLYISLFTPHFALAADTNNDGTHLRQTSPPIIVDEAAIRFGDGDSDALDLRIRGDVGYEPDFALFDRSIIGRAPAGVNSLTNNVPQTLNLVQGTTQVYVFEKTAIFGDDDSRIELRGLQDDGASVERRSMEKRQATKTVFLSANTCMQPQPKADTTTMEPPQLTMYVSKTSTNTAPGPLADMATQDWFIFTEGAVMMNMSVSDDLYFSISAPNVSATLFSGDYNFEVAASTDEPFHSYDSSEDSDAAIWVDSDAQAALLITHDLTTAANASSVGDALMKQTQPPFVMFAATEEDRAINGVRYSYCGLQNYAQISAAKGGKFANMVAMSMTRRGLSNQVKQQFYFTGLNSSTSYQGILAGNGKQGVTGSGIAGGGGHVARATSFATKSGMCDHHIQLLASSLL